MTRILAFSDVHLARNRIAEIVSAAQDADLVIGAGDFCNARNGLQDAMDLLSGIEEKAVYVPGNAESADELRAATNAPVLHGDALQTHGLRLFGIELGVGEDQVLFDCFAAKLLWSAVTMLPLLKRRH